MKAVLIKQGDGTSCQWSNCVGAGFSMVTYAATNGVHPSVNTTTHASPMPHAIRAYFGQYCPGIPWSTAAAYVQHTFGITIVPQYGLSWSQLHDFVIGGHPVDASIKYSAIHGTSYDACHTYDGLHSVAILGRRWNSTLGREEFLVGDPLADGRYSWIPTGPQWWPAWLVEKAMKASTGTSFVRAAIGPIPPVVAPAPTSPTTTTTFKKTAACGGGALRTQPNVSALKKGSLTTGMVCTITEIVSGGAWAASMCGVNKSGSKWYKITAVNGYSTQSHFGVAAVYAATGWFK